MSIKNVFRKPELGSSIGLKPVIKDNCIILLLTLLTFAGCKDSYRRWEHDLSGSGWRLYLDRKAEWKNDILHIHPVDIDTLPVNPPTCGWDNLTSSADKVVTIPGTVEGYFWSVTDSNGTQMGDYLGVSWWSTTFDIPEKLKGNRLTLNFQSVNLRAEVFVNQQLVGYDLIGNTPFKIDVTNAVKYGGSNNLDIRITDIGGTFSWDDEKAIVWGNYSIPSVHGFGGITGKVFLSATDEVHIEDIYIQNQPVPATAKAFITIENTGGKNIEGSVDLVISEWNKPGNIIWSKSEKINVNQGSQEIMFEINAPDAELWRIKDPHLYRAEVTFKSNDGKFNDYQDQKFGFKFMTIGSKDEDKRLYLNGERVFLLAAMTRGFWPKMGMFPIPGMAERDIKEVINLGYNMIMYHRAIGQPESMDLCDDMGIMTYEEPGGYQSLPYPPTEFAQEWRKEKLRRMIIRDRSRASLTNWNLDDWSYNEPNKWDYANIEMVHNLDPSRIVTFNCIQAPADSVRNNNPFQLHMLPFDSNYYYNGWFSPYHFAAQEGYIDDYYNNPEYYARFMLDPDNLTLGDSINKVPENQIYFLGEEGAFGTQLNLEKIKEDLDKYGSDGWMDGDYLKWYNSYNTFLDVAGMRKDFPTVQDLTMKIGHNLHYFHGRLIENCRIMNICDGYVLNGWAGASTNTDIVDTYRHPTGDPAILPYYAQPFYVAVKVRRKVIPSGTIPVADIFIINEKRVSGFHVLQLVLMAPNGTEIFTQNFKTEITGGEEFGQLLVENVQMPELEENGYYKLKATLRDSTGRETAKGNDEIFVANFYTGTVLSEGVVVIDTSGYINSFLKSTYGAMLPVFDPAGQRPSAIVLGLHDMNSLYIPQILEMVKMGTRLIILENAQSWVSYLPIKQIQSSGSSGRSGRQSRILRGRQFVGNSSLFDGLPQATAMSWEYQVFYRNRGSGLHISPEGLNTVVGVAPTNSGDIGIALCTLPFGNGSVLISTLSIVPNLINVSPDCAVAKKLFMNILKTQNNSL